MFKAHAPPSGAFDNVIVVLKLLTNLQENFIEVVCEGITENCRWKVVAALRQFIEVDNLKALVSVKLLDQHRVVTKLVGPQFNLMDFRKTDVEEESEELPLRNGERRGQKAFVDTTRINGTRWSFLLVDSDWIALC